MSSIPLQSIPCKARPIIKCSFLSITITVHCVFMFQIDEILDVAEKLKGFGNEQFKAQNYKVAEKKYTKTLR